MRRRNGEQPRGALSNSLEDLQKCVEDAINQESTLNATVSDVHILVPEDGVADWLFQWAPWHRYMFITRMGVAGVLIIMWWFGGGGDASGSGQGSTPITVQRFLLYLGSAVLCVYPKLLVSGNSKIVNKIRALNAVITRSLLAVLTWVVQCLFSNESQRPVNFCFDLEITRRPHCHGDSQACSPLQIITKEAAALQKAASLLGPEWQPYGPTRDADAGFLRRCWIPRIPVDGHEPNRIADVDDGASVVDVYTKALRWGFVLSVTLAILTAWSLHRHWTGYASPRAGVWRVWHAIRADIADAAAS